MLVKENAEINDIAIAAMKRTLYCKSLAKRSMAGLCLLEFETQVLEVFKHEKE